MFEWDEECPETLQLVPIRNGAASCWGPELETSEYITHTTSRAQRKDFNHRLGFDASVDHQ